MFVAFGVLRNLQKAHFLGHLKPSKTLFLVPKNQVFGGENSENLCFSWFWVLLVLAKGSQRPTHLLLLLPDHVIEPSSPLVQRSFGSFRSRGGGLRRLASGSALSVSSLVEKKAQRPSGLVQLTTSSDQGFFSKLWRSMDPRIQSCEMRKHVDLPLH